MCAASLCIEVSHDAHPLRLAVVVVVGAMIAERDRLATELAQCRRERDEARAEAASVELDPNSNTKLTKARLRVCTHGRIFECGGCASHLYEQIEELRTQLAEATTERDVAAAQRGRREKRR